MNFADTKFDIVLIAGQSNAQGSGYGPVEEEHLPDGVVYRMSGLGKGDKYENGTWYLSLPPEIKIEELDSTKSDDFGTAFVREYRRKGLLAEDRKILVLNTALGATSFAVGHWTPMGLCYRRMLYMLDCALNLHPENRVVALLWHQGESDASRDVDEATHYENLSRLLHSVRAKVGNVPIVTGDFCAQWKEQNAEKCAPIIRAIRRVMDDMGGAFIETADLPSNEQDKTEEPDQIHFSRNSLHILGKRFFSAYEQIKKNSEH